MMPGSGNRPEAASPTPVPEPASAVPGIHRSADLVLLVAADLHGAVGTDRGDLVPVNALGAVVQHLRRLVLLGMEERILPTGLVSAVAGSDALPDCMIFSRTRSIMKTLILFRRASSHPTAIRT
jgi:hypothetical protein